MEKEEQLIAQLQELIGDGFKALSINDVNCKPHPYIIGPKHVSWASDKWGGMITETSILDGEEHSVHCAHPGCTIGYKEHTCDKVLFVQLTRNMTNDEANIAFKKAISLMQEHKIVGLSFVETDEKFRVKA